jgi:hypothetical protein
LIDWIGKNDDEKTIWIDGLGKMMMKKRFGLIGLGKIMMKKRFGLGNPVDTVHELYLHVPMIKISFFGFSSFRLKFCFWVYHHFNQFRFSDFHQLNQIRFSNHFNFICLFLIF